jgi:hypothetical protein
MRAREQEHSAETAKGQPQEPTPSLDVTTRALAWVCGRDTGISSKVIWARMMYAKPERDPFGGYPHDPDDFGRCYRLLQLIPEWRPRIGEMAAEGPVWAALASAWDELTALYEQEHASAGGRRWGWSAPLLYARMQELGA